MTANTTTDQQRMDLTPHLRQYMHNDGCGFVCGYDKDGIDRAVAPLIERIKELEKMNERLLAKLHESYDWEERLEKALESIAGGEVMSGEFTHAETVLRYQQIARAALASSQQKGGNDA